MEKSEKSAFFGTIIKGASISVVFLTASILIFAGLITATGLSDAVIKPVNQFIKVISIFLGCFFSIKESKGFLKGLIIGLLFTVISYLLFALIGGNLSFGFPFVVDILFGGAVGLISGILTVSVKK